MDKICILGSGTWGTALANNLAEKGLEVTLCSKFKEDNDKLKASLEHPNLPGTKLNKNINFVYEFSKAIPGNDIVLFAAPSIFIRESAVEAKPFLNENQILVCVAKGIEENTLFTMNEVIQEVVGDKFKIVALSGPTHAEEVVKGLPTCITAASFDRDARKYIQKVFTHDQFRVYTNSDPKGVEVGAALKNIIALACGISDGLGYGDNAKAAIITRGLFEITNLGRAIGCDPLTFLGLSGVGDIVVTAISNHSRNHNAGYLIGKGYSVEETLAKVGMVVEGINSLNSAIKLAEKYNVEIPIISTVYDIIKNGKSPKESVNDLFARKLIGEKVFQSKE
ncbi:MAG: NAD(P)-dependent glycerol-3-phosphate dehydrogenase [Bacilli bacterium]|nr:NAD(P)-dependent glycerol-3-phosphate dehydrogenase [Bacilli bacterium]